MAEITEASFSVKCSYDGGKTEEEECVISVCRGNKRKSTFKCSKYEWKKLVAEFENEASVGTVVRISDSLMCTYGDNNHVVMARKYPKNGHVCHFSLPEKTFEQLANVCLKKIRLSRCRYMVYGCPPRTSKESKTEWTLLKEGKKWYADVSECSKAAHEEGWDQPDSFGAEVRIEGMWIDEDTMETFVCQNCLQPCKNEHYCPDADTRRLTVDILAHMTNDAINRSVTEKCSGCIDGIGNQLGHTCLGYTEFLDEIDFVFLYFETCFKEMNKDTFMLIANFQPLLVNYREELFAMAQKYWKDMILQKVKDVRA